MRYSACFCSNLFLPTYNANMEMGEIEVCYEMVMSSGHVAYNFAKPVNDRPGWNQVGTLTQIRVK